MLPAGQRRIVSGRVELFDGIAQMVHPDHILRPDEAEALPAFEPVYPLTEGLTLKLMAARGALGARARAGAGRVDRAGPDAPARAGPTGSAALAGRACAGGAGGPLAGRAGARAARL